MQQSQACISERHQKTSEAGIDTSGPDDAVPSVTSRPAQQNPHAQQMSETIWSTLRLALSYLNRTDLYTACAAKNLDLLKQEFKME